MGCFPAKSVVGQIPKLDLSNIRRESMLQANVYHLDKGGMLIKTSLGLIQYGMPPETVKDSMVLGYGIPLYYIIPHVQFDWKDGMNLMEFEFPVYYNFFLKKQTKTKIICSKQVEIRIRSIFQETLLGPRDFPDFEQEFVSGYKGIPKLEQELKYFAKNPFKEGKYYQIEDFMEFINYDQQNKVQIPFSSADKKGVIEISIDNSKVSIKENEEMLINFTDSMTVRKETYPIYKSFYLGDGLIFEPPAFGFTMLGNSHGFDVNGSTSGFVLWINGKGIMIDPPPYSGNVLKNMGITARLIDKIIITHCHADHDAGAFQKMIEESTLEFITTKTIVNSFLRKYSAICNMAQDRLQELFHYRQIIIGHPTYINGAIFTFFYSFHSIPTIGFEVEFENKKMYFSGDTFYNPEMLKKIQQEGVISQERCDFLSSIDFNSYDVILHESGIPPIHTDWNVLDKLSPEIKEKIFLYHLNEKELSEECSIKVVKIGLSNTYTILGSVSSTNPLIEKLEIMNSLHFINWIPLIRVKEIIDRMQLVSFKSGEQIVVEGSPSEEFFIVKKGSIKIFSNTKKRDFSKLCYSGEYFGESGILKNGHRLASVEAKTDVELFKISNSDFRFIFSFSDNVVKNVDPIKMITNLGEIRRSSQGEFINKNSFLGKMSEHQKTLLNMLLKEHKAVKGEVLWNRKFPPKFCLILRSGSVKLKCSDENQRFSDINNPGAMFGDFPYILNKETCTTSAVCLIDSFFYKLPWKQLKMFLGQYPGLTRILYSKMVIY